jgi:excisionase family DNA binding protein
LMNGRRPQRQPPASTDAANGARPEALSLRVPPDLVEVIAARAAELMADRLAAESAPFLNVAGAAEYLACAPSRIYALVSTRRIPHHRDGSRLLFRRSELDAWVRRGGAQRP